MFHIHCCIESTSTIFTFFTSFIYLSFALSLVWSILHSCPPLFRCVFIVQWDFCLGISPVHALCLSQSNSLHCTSSPFPPILYCLSFSDGFLILFLHKCDVAHYYLLSFFPHFPPTVVSSTSPTFVYTFCIFLYVYTHIQCIYTYICVYNIACIFIGYIFQI
jgi:hypothetical protein